MFFFPSDTQISLSETLKMRPKMMTMTNMSMTSLPGRNLYSPHQPLSVGRCWISFCAFRAVACYTLAAGIIVLLGNM